MEAPLTLEMLSSAFAEAGQRFPDDARGVVVALVRDCHFESLELTLEVLGSQADDAPVLGERIDAPSVVLDEAAVLAGEPVPVEAVLGLFEPAARSALLARGEAVQWLWGIRECQNPPPIPLDVRTPTNNPPLLPLDQ
ncbi:MAG: hypothetical protein A3K19_29825 [Lentisphaerae bacterium RIFOXYB12_FULL_65_16]|nr:MAG: hypothetical protein A3K18_33435 [Lentisphaerae bacterium RIFOXYA12_64_32]OGV86528.1 MAG: hypothetical protein A3K19_29825 [Lentisphaerae bacterium RIFOXYB12_FULL_65_16]